MRDPRKQLAELLHWHPDLNKEPDAVRNFNGACRALLLAKKAQASVWKGDRAEAEGISLAGSEPSLQDCLRIAGDALLLIAPEIFSQDIFLELDVSATEILLGNFKHIHMVRKDLCAACHGMGSAAGGRTCAYCGGSGFVESEERIGVEIPPGCSSGNLVRIAGKGNVGRDGVSDGDLYVVFREVLPPEWRRMGSDLHIPVVVDLHLLVLGGTTWVDAPSGERVYFKIPPCSRGGHEVILSGQGFPALGQLERKGNLACQLHPRMPRSLNNEERELWMRLREISNARSSARYITLGIYGVLLVGPEQNSPIAEDELVDLALILQESGLVPAADLTALPEGLPSGILSALVAVYRKCFHAGRMKLLGGRNLQASLSEAGIEGLFEVVQELRDRSVVPEASRGDEPGSSRRIGRYQVYAMGSGDLGSGVLLDNPELLSSLEPQGHPFKAYDLGRVDTIDSFFIGRLVRLFKFANSSAGAIVLVAPGPQVLRTLEETGVLNLFQVISGLEDLPP